MTGGRITIDVRETATRTYVGLEWRNGLLSMRADINSEQDVQRAHRMAEELRAPLHITDRAREMLEVRKG
ncbi:hypothetical protein [Arhodomonas sp. AD133]|uniref:hypothetical protein n=1 Tax=Arhodomonas sp. AD133 TaxID=3415009 RepID=UPI003EBF08D6